jgi:predicted metal-dependent HD superfamily phosphohydrolase
MTEDVVVQWWKFATKDCDHELAKYVYTELVNQQTYTDGNHRHYHNWNHVTHVVQILSSLGCPDIAAFFAAYFHDYHIGHSPDDEIESIKHAQEQMELLQMDSDIITRTVRMIWLTSKHREDMRKYIFADELLLLDADLHHFSTTDYPVYAQQIKDEICQLYNVDELTYLQGRSKFLSHMLDKDVIYYSEQFRHLEQIARKNIENDIASMQELIHILLPAS